LLGDKTEKLTAWLSTANSCLPTDIAQWPYISNIAQELLTVRVGYRETEIDSISVDSTVDNKAQLSTDWA